MYRCSECQLEYSQKPSYCECGNDLFEEIIEETYNDAYDTFAQEEELEFHKYNQKKRPVKYLFAMGFLILCMLGSIILLGGAILTPSKNSQKAEEYKSQQLAKNIQYPSFESIWDNTPPKGIQGYKNKKIINKDFSTVNTAVQKYIVDLGRVFVSRINSKNITGNGFCEIQFHIDKQGYIKSPSIIKSSHNHSLDAAVNQLLQIVTKHYAPPQEYNNEIIVFRFQMNEGKFQILLPKV